MANVIVDPNYHSVPFEEQNLYESIAHAMKLMETKPFKEILAKPVAPLVDRCLKHRPWTDQYLRCLAKTEGATSYHYCCSARMGSFGDSEAVVDSQLRVFNTIGLRIVDASVMPSLPRSNPNSVVMMVAERAADFIKHDYGI